MIERTREFARKVVSPSARTMNTWILMDFSRFAISKLRDMELTESGVTPEQTAILKMLIRRDGKTTINEIASYWMRQTNSISTLINRMSKQGMVEKIKHPGRKELEIVVTPKGRQLLDNLKQDSLDEVFSILTADDLQKLAQYLQLLLIKSRKMLGYHLDLPPL